MSVQTQSATNTPTPVAPQRPAAWPQPVPAISMVLLQVTVPEEYLHWVITAPPAINTPMLRVLPQPLVWLWPVPVLVGVLLPAGQLV